MVDARTYDESGYWYPDRAAKSGVELLNAMRRYRSAEVAMRQRTRDTMHMGATDMAAVRFLLQARQRGTAVKPTGLAAHLGITTASTTALVKRLVAAGHVERQTDPDDGRGFLLVATDSGDETVRSNLTAVHARMIAAADRLSPTTIAEMSAFFAEMTAAMDDAAAVVPDDARGAVAVAVPAHH
ncbi:MarR family winged helix-turn-helix transcriptional regulator [Curtobacterium sp. MCBD17_008]|uniref:MarR family winged helix-turn-helix transcriptional regulator n=1 Tax=Curtobacterium sp. MCBD17_008 TaxID=2175656 RepID=UPI000DA85B47|nr:MarR family transcriptional regulator [Curtobacterium sp. MCBD17_008]PZE94758.1 MarR family transcriptional regulator [Curtobacterium sp. MCBD17_008]